MSPSMAMRRVGTFAVLCLVTCCWGGLALAESDPQAEEVTRQRNLFELGGYLGLAVPSTRHELVGSGSAHQEFAAVVAQISTWAAM